MRASAGTWPPTGGTADSDWPRLALSFTIALTMTGLPIVLHVVGQPLALLFCVTAAILAARKIEQDVPIIVMTASIFQNVFVSLASSNFSDFSQIEPLKSYNFVTTVVLWATVVAGFVRDPGSFSPFVRRLILASITVLAVVGVYFVGGLVINPRNSIIYARNIGLPIMIFQMFLLVAAKHKLPLPALTATLLAIVTACGYLEFAWNDLWLTLTNGWSYLALFTAKRITDIAEIRLAAQEGRVVTSALDYSASTFLNLGLSGGLNFMVQRLQGPNFHPISFGYLLAIMISFSYIHDRKFLALLATPLLLLSSAKGPIVLLVASVASYALARHKGSKTAVWTLSIGLLIYAVFVFDAGMHKGDYHVLGLMGGLNGFLKMPIGHTLGDGGNLSVADFSEVDWGKSQREGATTLAVESAVGVLFFQLGVMALPLFAFYTWLASIAWRLYSLTRAPGLAFIGGAVLILLVNGLYQEEAYFTPLSLGLLMGFVGLTLGAADRAIVARLPKIDEFSENDVPARQRQRKEEARKPHTTSRRPMGGGLNSRVRPV